MPKRYQILAQMLTIPRPMSVGEADTPAEAVRLARDYAKKSANNPPLSIGDTQTEQYVPVDEFMQKHGIR
jgi:hypothetical protein